MSWHCVNGGSKLLCITGIYMPIYRAFYPRRLKTLLSLPRAALSDGLCKHGTELFGFITKKLHGGESS